MTSSLQFLGSAMNALKRKNPLAESFLAQLEIDLEGTGVELGPRTSTLAKGMVTPVSFCASKQPGHRGILVDLDTDTNDCNQFDVPHSMDSVKCSPLFELRDTQATAGHAAAFRHNSSTSATTESNIAPGFESIHAQVNLDVEASYNNLSPHDAGQYQLPSRGKGNMRTMFDSVSRASSDMDCSNSDMHKTRSNSYKDSSSHTSFTPPSQNDDLQSQYQNNISKNSPSTVDSGSGIVTPSISAPDSIFYGVGDTSFSNFQQSQLFTLPFGPVSPGNIGTGWDMSGIEATSGTGLTPMADSSWNEILTGIQDWGTFPNDGGFDRSGRQQNS
jgi:hypothetical protein